AEVLRIAAALESASEHPIAAAITAAADGITHPAEFSNVEGLGVTGTVDGVAAVVGRAELLRRHGLSTSDDLLTRAPEGATSALVGGGGRARGLLVVADTVKPDSAAAVARLRGLGLTPVLLTGDRESVARRVAAEVGIDEVVAEVLPAGKVETVERLQRAGR